MLKEEHNAQNSESWLKYYSFVGLVLDWKVQHSILHSRAIRIIVHLLNPYIKLNNQTKHNSPYMFMITVIWKLS